MRVEVTPAILFERAAGFPGVVFLDGRAGSRRAPLSHVAWSPERSFRAWCDGRVTVDGANVQADVLETLDRFLDGESAARRTVVGAFGYDLRHRIEPRSGPPRTELPVVAAASYSRCYTYDHRTSAWQEPPPRLPERRSGGVTLSRPRPNIDLAEYRRRFERTKEWIRAGDVYQVNLSIAFEAEIRGDPASLYQRLAHGNPAPYGAYVDLGDVRILCNSPELFLARRGTSLTTRPIKGTRRRGRTPEEDARLVGELLGDAKEAAEHVMIVDL
ncbi:MAG: chorismate-binding protein, partial [Candidatus Binatia bacterium]